MPTRTTTLLALLLMLLPAAVANAPPVPPSPDQSTPDGVVQGVITAARWGHLSYLHQLCDPQKENDGDTECLCALSPKFETEKCPEDSGNRLTPAQFAEYFARASVQGEPRVEGDRAEVDFLFGPEGKRGETMELIKRGDKWYLLQF